MRFSRLFSAQVNGLTPQIITVETDLSRGLFLFSVVGLPDKAVEEAKDRVMSALKHSLNISPKTRNQKIVVSLSPAEIKKEGAYFDVSIALGYLLSSQDINFDPKDKIFIGELSLNGEIKPVRGVLSILELAKKSGFKEIYIPKENKEEGELISEIKIFCVQNLRELTDHLSSNKKLKQLETKPLERRKIYYETDFGEISGQEQAKRALVIAASGGHNIALYGPPGTGKTMLARAFTGILPALSREELLDTAMIYSSVGQLDDFWKTHVPFRSPHHTSSHVAVVGGGANLRPGEITMAHNGVLYLDEFPEFDRRVIESLREPLEDKVVTISRAKGSVKYPSKFILLAAMNPCPCGYRGSTQKNCVCSANELMRYKKKLSGPIIDRIDLWVPVGHIEYGALHKSGNSNESKNIRDLVEKTREVQKNRFLKNSKLNAHLTTKEIKEHIPLDNTLQKLMEGYAKKLELSPRSYLRVIKISRTIADIENSKDVKEEHLLEALQYRPRFDL